MSGVLLGSALEEAAKRLPKALKPEAVVPTLKKAGVKDEELQLSGIGVKLPEFLKTAPKDDKGRVSGESVLGLVNYGRDDFFTTTERKAERFDTGYNDYILEEVHPVRQNYVERIYNFENSNNVKDGSTHFADENYLMHTRLWDDELDGADTRVIAEIQSDVHQNDLTGTTLQKPLDEHAFDGLVDTVNSTNMPKDLEEAAVNNFVIRFGLYDRASVNEIRRALASRDFSTVKALASMTEQYRSFSGSVMDLYRRGDVKDNYTDAMDAVLAMAKSSDLYGKLPEQAYQEFADALYEGRNPIKVLAETSAVKKEAAWKTSWARKGLENEIKHAIKEGKQQIAVPIKNANGSSAYSDSAVAELRNIDLESVVSEFVTNPDGRNLRDVLKEQSRSESEDVLNALDVAGDLIEDRLRDGETVEDLYLVEFFTDDFIDMLREIAPAVDNNPIGSMVRSPGVQKWYETNVSPTVQKLAKQLGADFKTVEKNGVEYAVIDLTKPGVKEAADNSFKLYAGGGAVAYYMAVQQQGMPIEDVTDYMLEAGFTEEEIAQARDQQPKIAEAVAQGIPLEDISDYLEPKQTEESKPIPQLDDLPKEQQDAMKRLVSGEMMPADELVAAMQVIKPNMSSVTTRLASFFGDTSSVEKAQAAELGVIQNIQALGAKRGLNLQYQEGEWVVETPEGPVAVTPGILEGLAAEKGEIAGSMAGGIYGAARGMGAAGPVASPAKRAVGAVVGGLSGAIAGGVLGTEFDYMYQSMKLQEEMSAEIAAHKALTASEAAAYGEVIGLGLVKFGGTLWQGAKRAKNFIMDGNTEGARKALRENFFLSDDEVNEIVQRFERLVDTTGMTQAEKEIKAVATSLPGAEALVKAASAMDPQASRAVVKNVSDRATQLLEASGDMTTETGRLLKQDLDAYVSDVKSQYEAVKVKAAENPRNKYYKFNLDTVAVKPVLESLAEGITDPAVRERFLLQMKQAKRYTDSRTFSDLLELRQLVNEFRFNKRISKPEDYAALDEVIQNIDGKLEKGANWLFGKEGAKQWLGEFAQARKDYAQMKNVQKTVLYKVVNRPGITPEAVSKALLKYSDSIDGNYEAVMSMLPKEMRRLAERDMINQLVNKYTAGSEGGIRATQFPMLAKDLSTRSFLDDESRQLVKAIDMMSDVFKNDVRLGQNAGMMKVPEFQSYLTADPVVRAKFEIASTVFNAIKQRVPGSKSSREIALIKNAAKFLETPLNAKSVEALKAEAKDMVSLDAQIIEAQRAQANSIASELDASGQMLSFNGSGNILKYGETGPVKIAAHRIATPEVARQIAIGEGLSVDSKLLDDVLKRYGYKAVQYGSDKIKLLE